WVQKFTSFSRGTKYSFDGSDRHFMTTPQPIKTKLAQLAVYPDKHSLFGLSWQLAQLTVQVAILAVKKVMFEAL
ncbi:MAG TPA: hypothetical protein VK203_01415, partial [Nostocaceae cyanobacterium]|nr:hypothetical protein [Nostocaceae cyanobacterium]